MFKNVNASSVPLLLYKCSETYVYKYTNYPLSNDTINAIYGNDSQAKSKRK